MPVTYKLAANEASDSRVVGSRRTVVAVCIGLPEVYTGVYLEHVAGIAV